MAAPIYKGGRPFVKSGIRTGNNTGIFNTTAAPVDGTTLAGVAGPGSLLMRTNGSVYVNTNTKASPTWTLFSAQQPSVTDKVLAATVTYDTIPAAANITGFSWTVAAAATYIFEMELSTVMTTVGGLTVNFKLTTATLASIGYSTYASTAVDNTLGVSTKGTTTTDATKVFDSKTSAYTRVRVWGAFVTTLGGTFAWQATQNTSGTGADVTSIFLNSYARLVRTA